MLRRLVAAAPRALGCTVWTPWGSSVGPAGGGPGRLRGVVVPELVLPCAPLSSTHSPPLLRCHDNG